MKKLILIGYMGCGKSTISLELSKVLDIPVVDLDQIIEENHKMSVQKIFETKGELYFRKMEHQLFSELIQNDEAMIISTGGGTPCYFNNHLLLQNQSVFSIYLKGSINTLYDRLQKNDLSKRPILSNLKDFEAKEFIAKHLFERSYFYFFASKVVEIDNKSVIQITNEITQLLA
jgi:shikimate kinase